MSAMMAEMKSRASSSFAFPGFTYVFSKLLERKGLNHYCVSFNQPHHGDGPTSVLKMNQYSMTVFTV